VTDFRLRDAGPADVVALAALFRRASLANEGDRVALLAHPNALVWPGPPPAPARCRVAAEGGGGRPVGFATTVPITGTGGAVQALELEDLFVEPTHWRRGVARRLTDDVLDGARQAGAHRIEVDADPHARDVYLAVGYVVVGETATELGTGLRMRRAV